MKLQITDIDGKVVNEKQIVVREQDTLVMVYDNDKISIGDAHQVFNGVSSGLENNTKLIAIPNTIELQVIKKLN